MALISCDSHSDTSETAIDSTLPGPERAAAAAARVASLLTPALREKNLQFGNPVHLRAYKEERQLELWIRPRDGDQFVLFKAYDIAAASGRPGPKLAEGDRQVPEGFYAFGPGQLHPSSIFHLAFNIGYPNAYDRHHRRTGSFIMVHGGRDSIGCLAMTDPAIEEIYTLCAAALDEGQPFIRIHLFPFRMHDARLATTTGSEWHDFWLNLKQGYDHFETHRLPPDTTIENGRYVFK